MKSSIKKITALGCSAVLLMGLAFPVSAAEASEKEMSAHMQMVLEKDSTYEGFLENKETLTGDEIECLPSYSVFSEFEKLEDMQAQPIEKLYAIGMTAEEVKEFKSTSVKDMVLENADETLSDERLREKGLDEDAIQAIRNGDYNALTEAEARRASAELHLGLGNWAHAGTSANCSIYWWWDDKPLNKWEDTVSSYISNGFEVTGSSTCKVNYADLDSMTPDTEKRFSAQDTDATHVSRFDFPMVDYDKWAQSGKAFVAHIGPAQSGIPINFTGRYYHQWYPTDIRFDGELIHFNPAEGILYTVRDTFY